MERDNSIASQVHRPDGKADGGVSLGALVSIIIEYRWLAIAFVLLGILFGLSWSFVSRPEYRANGLLQIEEKASSGASALKDLGPLLGLSGDTTVAAEQEILSSRMVLGKVIERQRLNVIVEPIYFPIVGAAFARRYSGETVSAPLLGLSSYSWGGESIKVESFDVPLSMQDRAFSLIVGDNGTYKVFSEDGVMLLDGAVGVRSSAGKYSIYVQVLQARSGTRFKITRLSPDAAMSALLQKLGVKERGKKSGILELTLQGADSERLPVVLDDVMNTYVRQNVERRSAEAENTLQFLQKQIPEVKRQLDQAEAAYNGYRQNRGSLDLSIETQSVLSSIVDVENQIVALKQERDDLRQYFTSEHPRIQAADARIEKLKARRAEFESVVSKLPDTQQTMLRLSRDVEVSSALYTNLLNTSQQLKVSKAGTVGDVRIIDNALVGGQPIGLRTPAFVVIGAVVGSILAFFSIWIRRALKVVVEDPEEIEARLGLPVYASIPHSQEEATLGRSNAKGGKDGKDLLAVKYPDEDAVESLRSLRTTIHFALLDSQQNSLLITGASPGLGKSFISKNLGVVLAQSGKRVVIVDADLRRGHIHKEFGLTREGGISEYVAGDVGLDWVLKPTMVPGLQVVTTGQIPPNPSELLMHLKFEEMLEEICKRADTVIVDAPPILAVSDAAIIGRLTGAVLMVARAGRHPIGELEQAVKRLEQSGVHVKGFVFNDYNPGSQRYRYGYKGHIYQYSYKKGAGG